MKSTKFAVKNTLSKEKNLLYLSLSIIILYFLPYILLGEDAPLQIHDNLDSNLVWVKIFFENGNLLSPSSTIEQVVNGIPRSSINGSIDCSLIWFKLFGYYWGYVFNKFLMSIVGFIGMYLLLKNHFIRNMNNPTIIIGPALLFSLLPFWSFTMSVCGLPLLFYVFLNLRNKQTKLYNWIIILVFPFSSSLILAGVFFIFIIGVLFLYDTFKTKKINFPLLLGIILLSCFYILSHYPLFYSFFFQSDYVSHRVEFNLIKHSFFKAFKASVLIFFKGQYHAHSLHTLLIIPIFGALFLMIKHKTMQIRFVYLLFFIGITSFTYGMLKWQYFSPAIKWYMNIIPLQIQRFHFLQPIFWYILLSLSFSIFLQQLKYGKKIVYFILVLQLIYVAFHHEIYINRKNPSFRQFYAEEQFEEIKNVINQPQESYRIVSIGIHPAIAQYNGFYTLDGYLPDYSLDYKHKFRSIIKKELDKDENLKNNFDNWGSRCYAFSAELGNNYLFGKNNHLLIENLEYKLEDFKTLGGKFIISSVEINIKNKHQYNLIKIFKHFDSYWKIYLYEIL